MHDDLLDVTKNVGESLLDESGSPHLDKHGNPIMVITREAIALAKLDSDNKKWLMERMKPKKYGNKLQPDHMHNVGKSLQELLLETMNVEK